jgi:formate dehydrogenase major subunit
MTNSFNEFARAKMFMVIGSNMIEAHPVAATYVKNAIQNGAKMILVDPRRHRLADFADIHVPIRVGSDIAFLNGLMHVLIQEDLYDKTFVQSCTVGFDELKKEGNGISAGESSKNLRYRGGIDQGSRKARCIGQTHDVMLHTGHH